MEKYESSIIMGQDIADYGGVFKVLDGFLDKFGKIELETPHYVNQQL